MKLESLVIADQNVAVNTFPGLVHTARHTMGVGNTQNTRLNPALCAVCRPVNGKLKMENGKFQRIIIFNFQFSIRETRSVERREGAAEGEVSDWGEVVTR